MLIRGRFLLFWRTETRRGQSWFGLVSRDRRGSIRRGFERWARLRKLAKMGCVKGLRSVSDGKLLGMALLALVIDTAILLFLRSNEWKKKKSRKCGIYFF